MTNKEPTNKTNLNKLPNWIFYFGCLLALIGGVAGLLGIISPTIFFNDFPDFASWVDISYVTTGWGIRNLAMCSAMILALWTKAPTAIAIVFSMRFLTEGGDLLNTLTTGHGSMGKPLIVVATIWIVLILIPEALAALWGIKRALAQKK